MPFGAIDFHSYRNALPQSRFAARKAGKSFERIPAEAIAVAHMILARSTVGPAKRDENLIA